jgi:hypothetical protein
MSLFSLVLYLRHLRHLSPIHFHVEHLPPSELCFAFSTNDEIIIGRIAHPDWPGQREMKSLLLTIKTVAA